MTNSTGSPLYELLLPQAGFNVRVSRIGIGSMGAVEHYLGLLAATMGHLDGAVRHVEAAMRLNARRGPHATSPTAATSTRGCSGPAGLV